MSVRPSNWDDQNAGTENNPYLISNLSNLRWLSETASDWWKGEDTHVHFLQTADIDATESINWNNGKGFRPIGRLGTATGFYTYVVNLFIGVYDGNNHIISNIFTAYDFALDYDFALEDEDDRNVIGLFSFVKNSTIKNLDLENIQIASSYDSVGTIAGMAYLNSLIQNCNTSGSIIALGFSINSGGILGEIRGAEIINCSSAVNIFSSGQSSTIGGIVGYARNSNLIKNNISSGFLQGEGIFPLIGGIVGYALQDPIIEHNQSNASIKVIGDSSARAGGIVGTASRNVTIRYNSSFASIDINAIHEYAGGIVAEIREESIIDNCYALVDIIASNETHSSLGGITGLVSGGATSTNRTQILNSFAIGSISVNRSTGRIGGIASRLLDNTIIDKCYSAVKFLGPSGVVSGGGIVNNIGIGNRITVSNSFWDIEISNTTLPSVSGPTNSIINTFGKTTSQMKDINTFTEYDWDFSDVWDILPNINTGYPHLRKLPDPPVSIADPVEILPTMTRLHGNFPNPFNPETTIRFYNEKAGEIIIDIYNIRGQKVTTVCNGFFEPDEHSVIWNGRDDSGQSVGSGIYFYKLTAGKYTDIKKMVLLK